MGRFIMGRQQTSVILCLVIAMLLMVVMMMSRTEARGLHQLIRPSIALQPWCGGLVGDTKCKP
ncbi:hypothetical protein Scep_029027 [Stephania cephalantha]|uniref:Uncharacterized protein n=1 Tax=Stephania cephalantha TaxID=152367 RepID=A0AAP0ED49_9MAGN